ncbi:MAG: LLM class flavin-dependent oxidoreductase, partial [Acetobacteraceae bacterium]
RRYDQGLEWFEVFRRICTADAPFDFHGQWFDLRGVFGRPRPLQQPYPFVLNAGFSDAGRAFAAQAADGLFTSILDPAAGAAQVADMAARTVRTGREVAMFTFCPVICRASRDEAEAVFARVAEAEADTEAVTRYMADKETYTESHDPAAYRLYRRRFVLGSGGYPLIGTPRDVAEGLAAIAAAGFAGVGVSFVNYTAELPGFIRMVLPLLAEAGLRAPP